MAVNVSNFKLEVSSLNLMTSDDFEALILNTMYFEVAPKRVYYEMRSSYIKTSKCHSYYLTMRNQRRCVN